MALPTPIDNSSISGRVDAPDPSVANVAINRTLDFSSAAEYALDFGAVNQAQVFGAPRTIYVENTTNPNPVNITISITGQFLVIPAYSSGYYAINATIQASILFQSDGGASSAVNIGVYNYVIQPSTWTSQTNNPLAATAIQGSMSEGSAVAGETNKNPVYVGGIDRATGLFHGLAVSATGALQATISTLAQLPASLGRKLSSASLSVTNAGLAYETVAASATNQVLGGAGAAGDYLSHIVIQPATTAAGTVTIRDAGTVIFTFTTGTLSDLKPIIVPFGIFSVGVLDASTGTNVSILAVGNFT